MNKFCTKIYAHDQFKKIAKYGLDPLIADAVSDAASWQEDEVGLAARRRLTLSRSLSLYSHFVVANAA